MVVAGLCPALLLARCGRSRMCRVRAAMRNDRTEPRSWRDPPDPGANHNAVWKPFKRLRAALSTAPGNADTREADTMETRAFLEGLFRTAVAAAQPAGTL